MTGNRIRSLSLRRAWIEMPTSTHASTATRGRSPYGERGLKCVGKFNSPHMGGVALLTESVD